MIRPGSPPPLRSAGDPGKRTLTGASRFLARLAGRTGIFLNPKPLVTLLILSLRSVANALETWL